MSTAVKSRNEPLGLDESRELLDRGELVPPIDNVTADGLDVWGSSPPLYHNLSNISYTKYDVQEWTGRLKKFKAETVRQAERCRELEAEIAKLHREFGNDTEIFQRLEDRINTASTRSVELEQHLHSEIARRNQNSAEVLIAKRTREELLERQRLIEKELGATQARIGLLKTEVERNRAKHETALGEKEKLNLERRWAFHERLLLEDTTTREIQDIQAMRTRLETLRKSLQQAWRESKKMDFLGHKRATKRTPLNEEWFQARRRIFRRTASTLGPANAMEGAAEGGGPLPQVGNRR